MKKSFYEIIHETKQGQTFRIKFTKKDGTVREYKDCTIWHEYEPKENPKHTALSSRENWEKKQNVMFWASDAEPAGFRIANENQILEVEVNG